MHSYNDEYDDPKKNHYDDQYYDNIHYTEDDHFTQTDPPTEKDNWVRNLILLVIFLISVLCWLLFSDN